MKYNVGDKVRIKSLDWYNRQKNETEVKWKYYSFSCHMTKYCGQIMTISIVGGYSYSMIEDDGVYSWTDEMIEGLVEEEIIDLTSIVMETVEEKTIQNALTYGYNLPEGYQFVDEGGNVINAKKIVLEKKKTEYPKTYASCCDTLYRNSRHDECYEACLQGHPMHTFARLLICRDAYWKIAGDEMGLGKPWEPDYTEESYEQGSPIKYVIYYTGTYITKGQKCTPSYILSFPTAEMRDAFYENFKKEIEVCKELL